LGLGSPTQVSAQNDKSQIGILAGECHSKDFTMTNRFVVPIWAVFLTGLVSSSAAIGQQVVLVSRSKFALSINNQQSYGHVEIRTPPGQYYTFGRGPVGIPFLTQDGAIHIEVDPDEISSITISDRTFETGACSHSRVVNISTDDGKNLSGCFRLDIGTVVFAAGSVMIPVTDQNGRVLITRVKADGDASESQVPQEPSATGPVPLLAPNKKKKASVSHNSQSVPSGEPQRIQAAAEDNGIQQQIDRIRNGPHGAMPQAQTAPSALGGQTSMNVENATSCTLSVFLSGLITQTMQIAPGTSQARTLPPGNYEVAASVSCPNVIPFYGRESFSMNTEYSEKFYIASH
jgi:hypothetical protein